MSCVSTADSCFARGVQHQAAGEVALAMACFRKAIEAWPRCAAAWANLGLLHEQLRAWTDAVRCHGRAVALDPSRYEAVLNLGALLVQLKRFDAAEQACRRAIALRPQAPAAWSNLGAMLAGVGRHADAESCLRHALALDPRHAKSRFNLGYPLLRQGRLREGFLCLESRDGPAALQGQLQLQAPRWAGDDLGGRSLLLVSDAGHGDLIQMARYGPLLKERGAARITLYGQPALVRLLAGGAGLDRVIGFDEPLPRTGWDLWAPVMSLPYLCGTDLDSVPAATPYLHADPARAAHWRRRLGRPAGAAGLRVGLVWRGNPKHESDDDRSLPGLATMAPLGGVAGVRLFSLQAGAGAADAHAPPPGLGLEPLGAPLGDFAETAALVANLDLVIAVDTSIVHLAGALGVPAWVLLADHKPDWRWLDGRDGTPWYPRRMRIFRQPRGGNWAALMAQVAGTLQAEVARRS
jgi:Flp pilus assembly protein TadD